LHGEGVTAGDAEETGIDEKRKFSSRPAWQRASVLLGGVAMNAIFGWILFSVVFAAGVPFHLAVSDVAPDSPAAAVPILPNDIIVQASYGGETLNDPVSLSGFISLVNNAGDGEIALKIKRGGETLEYVVRGRLNPPDGQGNLGVSLLNMGVERLGFAKAIYEGAKSAGLTVYFVAVNIWDVISKLFTSQDAASGVSGPVGIVVIARQTSELGIIFFIQLLAMISLNLTVLNLIPFPALDGGKIIVVALERLMGRAVPERATIAVNSVGLLLLAIILVLVTIQDVNRFF